MQGRFTLVEYYGKSSGHRCGYCKSSSSNYSYGLWAHSMTVQDYQDLINRGFRRSGHYCYKPDNKTTCCPLYTIKCDALDFKITKSQKKICKRMNKFLKDGKRDIVESRSKSNNDDDDENGTDKHESFQQAPSAPTVIDSQTLNVNTCMEEISSSQSLAKRKSEYHTADTNTDNNSKEVKTNLPSNIDPERVRCKKAKQLRLERKMEKLVQKGLNPVHELEKQKTKNIKKSLEDFLNDHPTDGIHKLKLKIVPSSRGVSDQIIDLYRKYQVTIHNDPPSKITKSSFARFLCESPLKLKLLATNGAEFNSDLQEIEFKLFEKYQTIIHGEPSGIQEYLEFLVYSPLKVTEEEGGPVYGFGSFHQQYWLDNKLIAVAVIDILPESVSSVYFFYDPDYRFLSLGTYSSLQELALTRQLQKTTKNLSSYYMGFYIHSCPKMRYKGKLVPSYLLCPEVFTWHLLDASIRNRLDENKYQRFNPSLTAQDQNRLDQDDIYTVKVLYGRNAMYFRNYLECSDVKDFEDVYEYASLVGKVCAKRMLLYRS